MFKCFCEIINCLHIYTTIARSFLLQYNATSKTVLVHTVAVTVLFVCLLRQCEPFADMPKSLAFFLIDMSE